MTTTHTEDSVSTAQPASSFRITFSRAQQKFPILQLLLIVVVLILAFVTLPGFGSYYSIISVLVLAALVGITAIGQTVVVLTGGFDLSVPGFIVLGAVSVSTIIGQLQLGPLGAVVMMLLVPALLGGAAGWLCHRFQISPIVMTLAMNSIALGIAAVATDGSVAASAPDWLRGLSVPVGTTFGLPVPPIIVIWVGIGVLVTLVLALTPAGRRLYATGANMRAADNALIRTRWVWVAVYAFSAIASMVAGALLLGFAGGADLTLGNPYLFLGLAAVIVGGTVAGGPGDYIKTVIGAVLITLVSTVFIGNGFTPADRQILLGVIILVAMLVYGRERSLRDRV